jgi:hypothetical protein
MVRSFPSSRLVCKYPRALRRAAILILRGGGRPVAETQTGPIGADLSAG